MIIYLSIFTINIQSATCELPDTYQFVTTPIMLGLGTNE